MDLQELKFYEEKPEYVREAQPEYGKKKKYTLEDYYALPEDERVELIDGVFYHLEAPTSMHQLVSREIVFQLGEYLRRKKGKCELFYAPVDVQLDCDKYTMLQPDILIICDRDKVKAHIIGAPDFIVEI